MQNGRRSAGEFAARYYDLGATILKTPALAAAITALAGRSQVEASKRGTIQCGMVDLRAQFESLLGHAGSLLAPLSNAQRHAHNLFMNEAPVFRGMKYAEFLQLFRQSDFSFESGDDLDLFKSCVHRIVDGVAKQPVRVPGSLVQDAAHALIRSIDRMRSAVVFLDQLSDAESPRSAIERLQEWVARVDLLRSGVGTWPIQPDDRLASMMALPNFDVIQVEAQWIATAIEGELATAPLRALSAHRLRTYLEHFAGPRLASEMLGDTRRAEQILQHEVDRFLFSEGFFPIVHAEASGGRMDTFVPPRRELFVREGYQGGPAFLLELKQRMDPALARGTLVDAVDSGLRQATEYRKHVAAFQDWLPIEVFVLVAYGGSVRYQVSADEHSVLLVHLGSATPSDGVKLLR